MTPDTNTQRRIVSHALLSGLALLIPIPFVDDMVVDYFRRRLVRRMTEQRGTPLAEADVRALVDDPSTGCLPGCLGSVVLYPLKKILRNVFFFLELKRVGDLVSTTYHRGLMLDWALAEGRLGPRSAAEIRAAMDAVLAETPVGPVNYAVRGALGQSTSARKGAVAILQRALPGGTKEPKRVEDAVESVRAEEERQISGVVDLLQQRLGAVPEEHFRSMRERFLARLG